jgi:HEAT repeat protein
VLDFLKNGPPPARLAITRALGAGAWPDPGFIEPLMSLVRGREPILVAAAAQALSQYQNDPAVLDELTQEATSTHGPDLRQPIVRAIGTFTQKKAARTLVDLLSEDELEAIQIAAGDALVEMTGRNDLDHDPQKWAQWYAQNSQLSDADFRTLIIRGRGEAFVRQAARHRTLESAADALLVDNFWSAPPENRAGILLSYLQSPAPEIRALGADLVHSSAANLGAPPPGTIQQTRLLLSDPSAEVRAAAATALSDVASVPALVAQLGREQDDLVRVRLIDALSPFQDSRAIEQMLILVRAGPPRSVRIAAANGIRLGSDVINRDPALKSRAIDALKSALHDTAVPGEPMLRAAVVGALASLRDESLADTFRQLLSPAEPTGVRASALLGLGNLPNSAEYVGEIDRFLHDESDDLRLAAVRAMGQSPKPMGMRYINELLDRMSEDRSDIVRSEAWNVVHSWALSPAMDEDTLAALADELKSRDPSKELAVRQRLRDRLTQDIQNARDDAERQKLERDRASQQTDIGELLQSPTINLPGEAAEQYRLALDYWKANGGTPDTILLLSRNVAQALLQAKEWDQAATFASGIIKDYGNDPNLKITVPAISREFIIAAKNLAESDDPNAYGDVMALFDAAGKMNPPLPPDYAEQLAGLKSEVMQNHAASKPGA